MKTPKGYRKAWNGGKPPAETDQSRAFHDHLDACQRCRDNPFELCAHGARLMREAIAAPEGEQP